jgi:hypothetical protein
VNPAKTVLGSGCLPAFIRFFLFYTFFSKKLALHQISLARPDLCTAQLFSFFRQILPRRRYCQAAAAAAPLLPSLLLPPPPLRCPHQRPVVAANVEAVALFLLSLLPLSSSSFPLPLPGPLLVDC